MGGGHADDTYPVVQWQECLEWEGGTLEWAILAGMRMGEDETQPCNLVRLNKLFFCRNIYADQSHLHMLIISSSPWSSGAGRKAMDQPRQYIKKQRHYFANKVCLVKATVFPVVMYGCESWTIKKAEC